MTRVGEKALRRHTKCVRRMRLQATPNSEARVADDGVETRKLLRGWHERIIRSEHVLMHPLKMATCKCGIIGGFSTVQLTTLITMAYEVGLVLLKIETLTY